MKLWFSIILLIIVLCGVSMMSIFHRNKKPKRSTKVKVRKVSPVNTIIDDAQIISVKNYLPINSSSKENFRNEIIAILDKSGSMHIDMDGLSRTNQLEYLAVVKNAIGIASSGKNTPMADYAKRIHISDGPFTASANMLYEKLQR